MAVWLFIVALFFGSTSGPQKAGNDGANISDAHPVRLANYNRFSMHYNSMLEKKTPCFDATPTDVGSSHIKLLIFIFAILIFY